MVALGGTSHQRVDLSAASGATYGVDDSVGWMNVTIYNQSADETTTLTNVTLGAVRYENGDQTIAYQGGGVWKGTEAGASMLSPPEFYFREATLTLPIITVDGTPSLGSGATVSKAEPTRVRYPNATEDPHFTNPLDTGHVNVTVHSEYYQAWGRFFAQWTDGNVSYNHTRGTARAKLIVPFNEDYDKVLAAVQPGGIRMNGNDPSPDRRRPASTTRSRTSASKSVSRNARATPRRVRTCPRTTRSRVAGLTTRIRTSPERSTSTTLATM